MRKLAATFVLCSGACLGTDTGNPLTQHGGEGTAGELCDVTERELAPEEATALGVSAAELFAWVAGEHRESLAWLDSSASFGPEHGASEITLRIEPGAPPRFRDREPAQRSSNGQEGGLLIAVPAIDAPCFDSIALPVRLHVSTAGGALDEVIETTLEARSADFVSGSLRLPTDALNGSFEAEVDVPNGFVATKAPELHVAYGLSEYGATGELSLSSEYRSEDGGAVGQGGAAVVARFPAEHHCGTGKVSVAAHESVRGLSMAAVLERLNALSPAELTGSGAALELSFASAAERVCVALDAPPSDATTLEFPGRVSLQASDQSVAGSIDVTLSGEAAGGRLQASRAAAADYLLDPAAAAAAQSRFAITPPIDFRPYDGGSFEFSSEVTETRAGGALRAYGLDQAECVTDPPPDPAEQGGSPGCAGTERIELWGVTWTAREQATP